MKSQRIAKKIRRGVFPLSADPIIFGHIDVITRAAQQSQQLTVLVCNNDTKKNQYIFSLEERFLITERCIQQLDISNIDVMVDDGLLVDVLLREGFDAIFRGIRTEEDRREDEKQLAYHSFIWKDIQEKWVYLPAQDDLRFLSSSMVKLFLQYHVNVGQFVPLFIKAALEKRIHQQWKIGVTGGIGVGKTWLCNQLVEWCTKQGIVAHHVNIDELIREIYAEQTPGALQMRRKMATYLGEEILIDNGREIDRSVFVRKFFSPECSQEIRAAIEQIVVPHVERLYRKQIAGKKGIIFIEWAQFVEMDMLSWVNNNMILVTNPDQAQLAKQRGVSDEVFSAVSQYQLSSEEKIRSIEHSIEKNKMGTVLQYKNHLYPHIPQKRKQSIEAFGRQIIAFFLDYKHYRLETIGTTGYSL